MGVLPLLSGLVLLLGGESRGHDCGGRELGRRSQGLLLVLQILLEFVYFLGEIS